MTANEFLRQSTIRRAHYIEMFKNNAIQDILRTLNAVDSDLQRQILGRSGATYNMTSRRLELMQDDIKEAIKVGEALLKGKVNDLTKAFSKEEVDWTVNTLTKSIPSPVSVQFRAPTATQVLATIRNTPYSNTTIAQFVKGWATSKENLFSNAVKQGFLQGQGIDDIARRLFGTRALQYKDGIADMSRRDIRTGVRTAINHISQTARDITYEENREYIKGVQWASTLDASTTLLCMGLDGKIDLDDGTVRELNGLRPPAHYNCRSTTVPVLKSLKEMGLSEREFSTSTRASMNGQVSQKETYATWFAKQDPAFQRSVLGKGRYELYKEGKVALDKFTDNGRTLTLKQLGKFREETNVPTATMFMPASKRSEAVAWAKEELGVRSVSYNGLDLDVVNTMNSSIHDHITMFPEMKANYMDIGTTAHMREQFVSNYVGTEMTPGQPFYERLKKEGYSEKAIKDYFTKTARKAAGQTKSGTYASSYYARYGDEILRRGVAVNPTWGKDFAVLTKSLETDVKTNWHPIGTDTVKALMDHENGHMVDNFLNNLSSTKEFRNIVDSYDVIKDLSKYPISAREKYGIDAYYREVLAEGWSEYINNSSARPLAVEIGSFIHDTYKEKYL